MPYSKKWSWKRTTSETVLAGLPIHCNATAEAKVSNFHLKTAKFSACWLSDQTTGCSRYCHLFSLYSPCYHGAYPLWLFDAPEILELPRQGGALPCSWKRLLRLQSDKNVRRFQVLQWGCGLEIKCMKSCLWKGWMKTIQAVNTHK